MTSGGYEPPLCSCGCGRRITDYSLGEYLKHKGWPEDDAKAVHGAVKGAVKALLGTTHKGNRVSDSVILRSNAVFAVVAYDEGDKVHAKTVWNPAFDHLSRENRERVLIAVREATNEAMFKIIRKAKR